MSRGGILGTQSCTACTPPDPPTPNVPPTAQRPPGMSPVWVQRGTSPSPSSELTHTPLLPKGAFPPPGHPVPPPRTPRAPLTVVSSVRSSSGPSVS